MPAAAARQPVGQHVTRGVVAQAAPSQQKETPTTSTSTSNQAAAVGEQEDPAYKYSDGINQFLGNFLPSSRAARDELRVDFDVPKLTGLSIDELACLVEQGLSKTQWFVTGEVDAQLFSDNFAFKDESVATTGIKAYATGVRKLFDQVRSRLCVPVLLHAYQEARRQAPVLADTTLHNSTRTASSLPLLSLMTPHACTLSPPLPAGHLQGRTHQRHSRCGQQQHRRRLAPGGTRQPAVQTPDQALRRHHHVWRGRADEPRLQPAR